jgi:hypothetical protein
MRRLEADDAAAKETFEDVVLIRTDGEAFGIRPRMCQNVMMVAREPLAQHARHQREVIVL